MNPKLLIGTGWYSDTQGHMNPKRSAKCLESSWLKETWKPYIERYVNPDRYFVYCSNCEILPEIDNDFQIVLGYDEARHMDHRHGFHCSVMESAQDALCHGMDWIYIEQDCMVYRLDLALKWARENTTAERGHVYGFGQHTSWQTGWAEQSFMFCQYKYLPEFLTIVNKSMIHYSETEIMPEKIWHELFKNKALFWQTGYGRRKYTGFWDKGFQRPEWFWFQQLTDRDIENMKILK